MTVYSRPQSDPTVQPVPASVVEQVDAADMTLSNPKQAVISLGANLGNRLETLQGAIDALEDTPGLRVKAVSPVYETEPWGVEPGTQPSYFNAVVLLKTTLPPSSLLERGHAIEEAFDRVRDERWGPRTLDVDIVAYADVVSDDPLLTLPAPPRAPARLRAGAVARRGSAGRGARARADRRTPRPRSARKACCRAPIWNSACPSSRYPESYDSRESCAATAGPGEGRVGKSRIREATTARRAGRPVHRRRDAVLGRCPAVGLDRHSAWRPAGRRYRAGG